MENTCTPEQVREQIRKSRHKAEVPLYVLFSLLGVVAALFVTALSSETDLIEESKKAILEEGLAENAPGFTEILLLVLSLVSLILGVGAIIGLIAMTLFMMFKMYANQISYGIRVSEKNFPEIYEKVREYSRVLGLKKEPEVYVRQQNGTLNAMTYWVPNKGIIQLNAEIVDAAYMEHKDFDTVYFTMAHEFGHYYLHHVQLQYTIWSTMIVFIPLIGPALFTNLLSRAREYSADRVAQALTGGKGQMGCMMLLMAGRHAYKYMNEEEYVNIVAERKYNVVERFSRFAVNLLANHPIMPFRIRALRDSKMKSGRLI